MRKCYFCGEEREDFYDVEDEEMCNVCYLTEYRETHFVCDNCEEVKNKSEVHEIDGDWYCDDCIEEMIEEVVREVPVWM